VTDILPEMRMCAEPNRIVAIVEDGEPTSELAARAVAAAQEVMPKVTGHLAGTLRPIFGSNFFGIYFPDRRIWFLEQGTRAHTMHSLAGKTVPMWIDDPSGSVRRENPKAKVRTTVDGRTQVQLFRRVGTKSGYRAWQSKVIRMTRSGVRVARYKYPGAAGRIARREAAKPLTSAGRTGGRIARGNVGVAWRNPGIQGRQMLNFAMTIAAEESDIDLTHLFLVDEATFSPLVRA
jgi:hypothetical protein